MTFICATSSKITELIESIWTSWTTCCLYFTVFGFMVNSLAGTPLQGLD